MSNVKLYCIKTDDDKIHYIGKTVKGGDDKINQSELNVIYNNGKLRELREGNPNINIQILDNVKINWFDEKLNAVVEKYSENHPLLNAQWMLDGKRGVWEGTGGFWKGKTRDLNTIQKLSESKFKKVCQFNSNGELIKIWNSVKDAATTVFNDYEVINGGNSYLYRLFNNKTLRGRFKHNSYWYKEEELIQFFGKIPTKLNLLKIRAEESKLKSIVNRNRKIERKRIYTVIQYDVNGNKINDFDNVHHASTELGIPVNRVKRIVKNITKRNTIYLKYGEKKMQKINI